MVIMATTNSQAIPPESVMMSRLLVEKRIQGFDFSEPKKMQKLVGTIVGTKNAGKTTNAMNLYESVLLIDFDGNGVDNKDTLVSRKIMKAENIYVLNASKYLSDKPQPSEYMLNYLYIKEACRKFKGKYDGIVVDTLDGLEEMLVERSRYLYGSSTGVTATKSGLTWQGWQERTNTLNELWHLFIDTVKVGVTYVTDYRFIEKVQEGKSITIQVPKWFDIVRRESKYLIEIDQYPNFEKNTVEVKAKIWGSKNEKLLTPATEVDITGYKPIINKKRLSELIGGIELINNTATSGSVNPGASGNSQNEVWN